MSVRKCPGVIDTEELRRVADFQDFAEHADLILAAAMTIDDRVLERDRCGCEPVR